MDHRKQFKYGQVILQTLDGQMSDEQFMEFDKQLCEDPQLRQYYFGFIEINADLHAIEKLPAVRDKAEQDIWVQIKDDIKSVSKVGSAFEKSESELN